MTAADRTNAWTDARNPSYQTRADCKSRRGGECNPRRVCGDATEADRRLTRSYARRHRRLNAAGSRESNADLPSSEEHRSGAATRAGNDPSRTTDRWFAVCGRARASAEQAADVIGGDLAGEQITVVHHASEQRRLARGQRRDLLLDRVPGHQP